MITSRIRVGCEVAYEVKSPSSFLFNVVVSPSEHQVIQSENFQLTPQLDVTRSEVGEGNRVQRVTHQGGPLVLFYTADVTLRAVANDVPNIGESHYSELPSDVLTYLNPSRYCESDRLAEFARRQFGAQPHGHERVQSICDWTCEHLAYTTGSTNASTTACDVLVGRDGVCRDFAHLSIAMCRGLGIPARYVAGYAVALEPPDFHGFLEAYLGDRWYLFDPTRLADVGSLVRIATGRDAADTPFATIVGHAALQNMKVWAERLDNTLEVDEAATGISTA